MFHSPILDVVIGMIFLFLLLSLLATAVQEAISGRYNLRGKLLKAALQNMLGDAQTDRILAHPLISTAHRESDKLPSYISKENFSSALIHSLPGYTGLPARLNTLAERIATVPDERLKRVLQGFDLELPGQFEAQVSRWYESVMDRWSGVYKRKIQGRLFWMGLIIAAVLNADAIRVYQHLASHDKARAAVVAQALQFTKDHPNDAALTQAAHDLLQKEIDRQNEGLKQTLGLGWYKRSLQKEWQELTHWSLFLLWSITKLLGWVISAFAITIGAPFWFDLLKKVIQIRNTGVKPGETK